MPAPDAAEWPLSGRDEELRRVVDALGRAGGVLLAGPAGAGKTRLAREALATRAGPVRFIRATASSRPIPLGALASLLGDPAGTDGDTALLARAHSALRAEPRLVLGIDDAHLLDEVSATLVHQLVAEHTVPVVVTIRTGEPAPAAVTALWKDGLLARLDVEALDVGTTMSLLEAVLDGPVHSDSARRLHAATSGNVLWLRQLVTSELRDARLARIEGIWTWAGEPRLTPALTDLIDARIGALADAVRPAVELLALAEPLDLDVLATLAGPAAVDEAIDRGLVAVTGERPEARLAHPLYGEVVRARSGDRHARRLRGIVATALADAAPDDLLRRATLVVESDLEPDLKLLLAAADRATQLTDFDLAIQLLKQARTIGAGFDAHLSLAYVLGYVFRGEEAEQVYRAADALARTDAQRLRLAQARATNLMFILDREAQATSVIAETECRVASATPLLGIRAVIDGLANRFDDAERSARGLLSAPEPTEHAATFAGWALSVVLAFSGRVAELRVVAAHAMTMALAAPEPPCTG